MTGRLGLLVCLAVAAALRFVVLGRADLWSDEVHTFDAVALPWGEMCAERLRAGHLPLWFLAEKAWVGVFGDGQFALRSLSALCGTLAVLPAWTFFRRMLAPKHATAAAALVAVHPLLVELSREARMYSLALLLLFVMLDGVAAALATGRAPRRTWIASALGCATHPTFAFGVGAVVLWLAWERRARPDVRDDGVRAAAARAQVAVASGLAVLVAALPFVEPQHQELTRRAWHAEAAMFLGRPLVGSGFVHVDYGTLFAAVLLGVWARRLFVAHRHRDGSPARRLGWTLVLAVPAASFLAGTLGGVPWGPARYIQAASVGWVLLVTAYDPTARGRAARSSRSLPVRHRKTGPTRDLVQAASFSSVWLLRTGSPPVVLMVLCVGMGNASASRPPGWSRVAEEIRYEERRAAIDPRESPLPERTGHSPWPRPGGSGPRPEPARFDPVVASHGDAVVLSHYLGRPVRVADLAEYEAEGRVRSFGAHPLAGLMFGRNPLHASTRWRWAYARPDASAPTGDAVSPPR